MWSRLTRQLIEIACEEDLGSTGDITSALLPTGSVDVCARVVPRQAGVVCGLTLAPVVCDVFSKRLGAPLDFHVEQIRGRELRDGDRVAAGAPVAILRGAQTAVLAAERTLLNFLGRMSGVATLTSQFVAAAHAANPEVKLLDTRKTVPGWRELDKYAVRIGGGRNHRLGLFDAILIKDNHLAGLEEGGLARALDRVLSAGPAAAAVARDLTALQPEAAPPAKFVEVEVDTLDQLAEVCQVPAIEIVLLDNFTPAQLRAAVQYRDSAGLRGKIALEASGGVTLDNVADIAATGVDRIAVGALTHSAPILDIGLDL